MNSSSGDFRSIETGKPRMSKKKKILIATIVCISVVLIAVIATVVAICVKNKHKNSNDGDDSGDVVPRINFSRIVIPLQKWMFYKNLTKLSSIVDSIDFSQILHDSEEVIVPHTWNNLDGQDGGNDYAKIPCSYQINLDSSLFKNIDLENKKIFVEFCGSNLKTTVYLDGEKVGNHVGGYAKFRFDITKFFNHESKMKFKSQSNLLTVVVDNSNQNEYYPIFADYTFFGGIYRNVNIIVVNKASFAMNDFGSRSLYIKPNAQNGEVEINSTISNEEHQSGLKVNYKIYDNNDNLLLHQTTSEFAHEQTTNVFNIKIPNYHLWKGREDPYLYRVRAELIQCFGSDDDCAMVDSIESTFGFRTMMINKTGFYLNNEKYQLRGVSRHQDRPDKGWAITNEEETEDFDLIYEMGANAVRLSHYQQNETVYDYCDKKGLIIICEIPFISTFLNTTQSELNLLDQLNEMVKQNFNHPCVAVWGIMNEVGMNGESDDEYVLVHKLQERAKSLDTNRQTYGAMVMLSPPDSPLNQIPDVIGYNLYGGWYYGDVSANEKQIEAIQSIDNNHPLSLTEYGAEAILKYHSDIPFSHDYTEEYQLIFHQRFYEIIQEKDLWGSFVWNMFDFASDLRNEGGVMGMNNKGLVTYDRKTKKEAFFFYKSVWNKKEKFVHVCGTRFHDRATPDINVTIITGKAALPCDLYIYVNGEKVHIFENNDKNLIVVRINLTEGKNTVKAVIKDIESKDQINSDSVEFEKVDSPNPDYMFYNKTDIDTKYPRPEGNYSVYDTIGDIYESADAWNVISVLFQSYDVDAFIPLIKDERFIDILISTGATDENIIRPLANALGLIPKVSSLRYAN